MLAWHAPTRVWVQGVAVGTLSRQYGLDFTTVSQQHTIANNRGKEVSQQVDNFEMEELAEPEAVPALHCGPGHTHMGFSLAEDEETAD